MKHVLISVSNKNGLDQLVHYFLQQNYTIVATGGTHTYISKLTSTNLLQVSDLTDFPEILDGRVKTLHPKIYAGLLAKNNPNHLIDIDKYQIVLFNSIVVNLYPFEDNLKISTDIEMAQELIDIGGVSLIRAGSKNYQNVWVLTDPNDYNLFIKEHHLNNMQLRRHFAIKGFNLTSSYDLMIANYLNNSNKTIRQYDIQLPLKYGCNPHQTVAGLHSINNDPVPFTVLNGPAGYINMLDAIGSWQLVNDVANTLNTVCVASFKHTSPAGVAISSGLLDTNILTTFEYNPQRGIGSCLSKSTIC